MTDPAGDALQHSLERIDSYSHATFGVRLTLSDPGDNSPHDIDSSGRKVPGILANTLDAALIDPLREQLWLDLLGSPSIAGVSVPAQVLRAALPTVANNLEPLFVAENLAAVPETLHETGIFGSDGTPGLIATAGGGTLYLAAVEHLSARSQDRLLEYLTTDPVNSPEHPRARIIASADIDLDEAASGGSFRRDLANRLTGLVLAVPPLRERPEDIPLIAAHLLGRHAAARGASPPTIAPEALAALKMHHWAGNVRQLDEQLARAGIGRTVIRLDDRPGGSRPGSRACRFVARSGWRTRGGVDLTDPRRRQLEQEPRGTGSRLESAWPAKED